MRPQNFASVGTPSCRWMMLITIYMDLEFLECPKNPIHGYKEHPRVFKDYFGESQKVWARRIIMSPEDEVGRAGIAVGWTELRLQVGAHKHGRWGVCLSKHCEHGPIG